MTQHGRRASAEAVASAAGSGDLGRRPSAAAVALGLGAQHRPHPSAASATSPNADRFTLLLLEDGEYYFKAATANLWEDDGRRCVSLWRPGMAHSGVVITGTCCRPAAA